MPRRILLAVALAVSVFALTPSGPVVAQGRPAPPAARATPAPAVIEIP
jgi:hypothetical protein